MTRPVTALKLCRYCNVNVLWAITPKGKWMPVDIEGDERGSVLLWLRGGVLYCRSLPFPPPAEHVDSCRHQSHSYSCRAKEKRK